MNHFSMMARAMVQQPPRGTLIAVEGIQNSGKTTLSKELVSRIAGTGTAVTLMQFPDGDCPTGNLINNLHEQHSSVPPESLMMLSSANKWEREGCIKRLVSEGTTVVLDGYVWSDVAESVVNTGRSVLWCTQMFKTLPLPDLYIAIKRTPSGIENVGLSDEYYDNLGRQIATQQYIESPSSYFIDEDDICIVEFGMLNDMIQKCWSKVVGTILTCKHNILGQV